MTTARPHRSRRIPACARCRTRRSKCTVEVIGKPCLLCQKSGTQCSAATFLRVPSQREQNRFNAGSSTSREPQCVDVHVVSPMVARDTHALEGLLTNANVETPNTDSGSRAQQQTPVYQVSVTRRPSPTHCECSQTLPMQLTRQVEPCLEHVIQLYLKELHPCLPMLDEESLRSQLTTKSSPQTFILNFEAYTLFYWGLAPALNHYARPDQDLAWSIACAVTNAHMHTGGLASIISAILNICGRPSKGVVHNMTNVARIVALANGIGLNHDCNDWNMSDSERHSRWRVWWAVLIHDRWWNFAQGTPPLVNAAHYNVPVPTMSILVCKGASDEEVLSAQCYIALCRLTEIIGVVLPLIYHVRSGTKSALAEQLFKSQLDLDTWLRDLPQHVKMSGSNKDVNVRGLANLQLSYLSTQMLIRRLAWYEQSQSEAIIDESVLRESWQAAKSIAVFIESLQQTDLTGFWLPYNVQHLTSTVTLLLRCALQTNKIPVRSDCIRTARNLVQCLRRYRDLYGWDLAEIALPQSETILQKIEFALPGLPQVASERVTHGICNATELKEPNVAMIRPEQLDSDFQHFDPICETSLEDLFPGIFSTFDDHGFFDQIFLQSNPPA